MKRLLVFFAIIIIAAVAAGFSDGGDSAQAATSPNVVCGGTGPKCGGEGGYGFDFYDPPNANNVAICPANYWHGLHIQSFGTQWGQSFVWTPWSGFGAYIVDDGYPHQYSLNGTYTSVQLDNRGNNAWIHVWGYCSL